MTGSMGQDRGREARDPPIDRMTRPQLGERMEIHFCDLCNESVPQSDLDQGIAMLRNGRVVCASCDVAMRTHAVDRRQRPSSIQKETRLASVNPTMINSEPSRSRSSSGQELNVVMMLGITR